MILCKGISDLQLFNREALNTAVDRFIRRYKVPAGEKENVAKAFRHRGYLNDDMPSLHWPVVEAIENFIRSATNRSENVLVFMQPGALPEEMLESAHLYAGCIAGALKKDDYLSKIKTAGFKDIEIIKEDAVELLAYVGFDKVLADIIEGMSTEEVNKINNCVVSLKVFAKKYE